MARVECRWRGLDRTPGDRSWLRVWVRWRNRCSGDRPARLRPARTDAGLGALGRLTPAQEQSQIMVARSRA